MFVYVYTHVDSGGGDGDGGNDDGGSHVAEYALFALSNQVSFLFFFSLRVAIRSFFPFLFSAFCTHENQVSLLQHM